MAAYLHAKTFVVDGEWSTVGFDELRQPIDALNDESTLMVLDGTNGQQMNQMFLDDLRHAQEITAVEFGQRRRLNESLSVWQT